MMLDTDVGINKYKKPRKLPTKLLVGLGVSVVGLLFFFFYRDKYSHLSLKFKQKQQASAVDERNDANSVLLRDYLKSKGDAGYNNQQNELPQSKIIYPKLERFKEGYPSALYRPLLTLIEEWNPDNPDPPRQFHEVLPHFNFSNPVEREMAREYRDGEVPFKLYDVPEYNDVAQLWTDEYLSAKMEKENRMHVERSQNNHFMFWNGHTNTIKGYKPPTDIVNLNFNDWLERAKAADIEKLSNNSVHYYFVLGTSAAKEPSFIQEDLKLFSTTTDNFFITNVRANKGIQCRFSMRGIIAETHYDSGKNMVAMLKGAKRYILTPPHTCSKLAIITDTNHPSYRHSVIDWSDVGQAIAHDFAHVDAIDTILRKGEILYIPSYWFHYIISLKYSIQCNSRSGSPLYGNGGADIEKCMGMRPGSLAGKLKKKLRAATQ